MNYLKNIDRQPKFNEKETVENVIDSDSFCLFYNAFFDAVSCLSNFEFQLFIRYCV